MIAFSRKHCFLNFNQSVLVPFSLEPLFIFGCEQLIASLPSYSQLLFVCLSGLPSPFFNLSQTHNVYLYVHFYLSGLCVHAFSPSYLSLYVPVSVSVSVSLTHSYNLYLYPCLSQHVFIFVSACLMCVFPYFPNNYLYIIINYLLFLSLI